MLDADAAAIEVAQLNVKSAAGFILSDCWAGVDEDVRYDWIVSNPPVHKGLANDLSVIWELIKGAAGRLVDGGQLWMVAQVYVPVGLMLEAAGSWGAVSTPLDDGRFVVWKVRI